MQKAVRRYRQALEAGDADKAAALFVEGGRLQAHKSLLWATLAALLSTACGNAPPPPADRVYVNGAVHTFSDWDVSSLNPLDAIETAVTRKNPFTDEGPQLGSGENVDLQTALEMYTRNAAFVMRLDALTGSIEVGKRADLIVLDRDLFKIPIREVNEARVLQTLVDGIEVYRNAD
jgi:hypothetical protein